VSILGHKKLCNFVFNYNSGYSSAIFTVFGPVETGTNTLQFTYLTPQMHYTAHHRILVHSSYKMYQHVSLQKGRHMSTAFQ